MSGTKTITLTDEECERLVTIISCNIDLTMTPLLVKYSEAKQIDSILSLTKTIESDQSIIKKINMAR